MAILGDSYGTGTSYDQYPYIREPTCQVVYCIIRPRSATAFQKRPCQIMPNQNRTLLEGAVAERALKIAPRAQVMRKARAQL
jgi:hypothetical protein